MTSPANSVKSQVLDFEQEEESKSQEDDGKFYSESKRIINGIFDQVPDKPGCDSTRSDQARRTSFHAKKQSSDYFEIEDEYDFDLHPSYNHENKDSSKREGSSF